MSRKNRQCVLCGETIFSPSITGNLCDFHYSTRVTPGDFIGAHIIQAMYVGKANATDD